MNHLELLLPFGLLPPQFGADLLRVLKTPALATLLARTCFGSDAFHTENFDELSRALPHETWSARRFGLETGSDAAPLAASSPPLATSAMRALGLAADAGFWFVVQPVHIHVARDHLILTDLRQVAPSEQDARDLFGLAQASFEQAGKTLLYGNANTWFVRADDWRELQTGTPDAACGRSIDIWMPKGTGELQWRKLQNEVQMEWFADPRTQERQAQQRNPANSIWLWGGAPATNPTTLNGARARYRETFNLPNDMAAYRQANAPQERNCNVEQVIAAARERSLLVLDDLIEAALASDWSFWLERMHALERDWFAPLLQALQSRKIAQLTLICSNSTHLIEATASTRSLRKFWVKPSLARLQP